ncbi:MAG: hypothetical protein ACPGRE_05015 [Flavobacteriaceae bacterium]
MKTISIMIILAICSTCYAQSSKTYIESSHLFLSEIQYPINYKPNLKLSINKNDLIEYLNEFNKDLNNGTFLDSLSYGFPSPKNKTEVYQILKKNLRHSLNHLYLEKPTSNWEWNIDLLNNNYTSIPDSKLTSTIYPPIFIENSEYVLLFEYRSQNINAESVTHTTSGSYYLYKKEKTKYTLVTSIVKWID